MCLLAIPFSVMVSRRYSIDAGNINACLSTIGRTVVVRDEKADDEITISVHIKATNLSYQLKNPPVVLLCIFPSYNSNVEISVLRLFSLK